MTASLGPTEPEKGQLEGGRRPREVPRPKPGTPTPMQCNKAESLLPNRRASAADEAGRMPPADRRAGPNSAGSPGAQNAVAPSVTLPYSEGP